MRTPVSIVDRAFSLSPTVAKNALVRVKIMSNGNLFRKPLA